LLISVEEAPESKIKNDTLSNMTNRTRVFSIILIVLAFAPSASAQVVYLGHSLSEVRMLLHAASEEKLDRAEENYDYAFDGVAMFGIRRGRARLALDTNGNVSAFFWKSSSDEYIARDSGIKIMALLENRIGVHKDEVAGTELLARFWTFGNKRVLMKSTMASVYYQEFFEEPKAPK
jgi:hypothetical protein